MLLAKIHHLLSIGITTRSKTQENPQHSSWEKTLDEPPHVIRARIAPSRRTGHLAVILKLPLDLIRVRVQTPF